ncbi:MAG: hypothetical protein QXP36_00900 [Conexivisphaerales archaeon]
MEKAMNFDVSLKQTIKNGRKKVLDLPGEPLSESRRRIERKRIERKEERR